MKKLISVVLIITMLFSLTTPAFANNKAPNAFKGIENYSDAKVKKLNVAIEKKSFKNKAKLPLAAQKLISETTSDPEENLEFADVINNQAVLVYKTEDSNTKVAVTDDFVEVIEQVDKTTFLINNEEHNIVYTFEDASLTENELSTEDPNFLEGPFVQSAPSLSTVDDGSMIGTQSYTSGYALWAERGYVSGNWIKVKSGYHNIHLENSIKSFTVAALATIIGAVIGGIPGSIGGFIAGLLLGSQYTNTSIAKAFIVHYEHASWPYLYRKTGTSSYAVYYGASKYLGFKAHYYSKKIGSAY